MEGIAKIRLSRCRSALQMKMMHGRLNTQSRQCLTNHLGVYDCDLSAYSDGVNGHKQQIRVSRGVGPFEYADQRYVGYYETPLKRMRQETKMINKQNRTYILPSLHSS